MKHGGTRVGKVQKIGKKTNERMVRKFQKGRENEEGVLDNILTNDIKPQIQKAILKPKRRNRKPQI